jgi:hypothetical protein
MMQTVGARKNKTLLEEVDSVDLTEEDEKEVAPKPVLRMKKINIDAIYSQAEKDREGEKLK